MRPSVAAIALCLLAVTTQALADQPLLRPSRDVDVTYRATAAGLPQDGKRLEQRVRWLAASQTMRIDPPTTGLYVIIDYVARRMSVVREVNRSVIEMAPPEGASALAGNPGTGRYARHGEDTVAGLPCTDWETRDRDNRPALVCITADGVLLRTSEEGQTLVSATSVQYAPQDPAAFRVPADYTHHSAVAPQ